MNYAPITAKHMQTIKGKLKTQYPPHHYKHVDVFTAFWALVEILELTEEIK